jgi:hypothetical protein
MNIKKLQESMEVLKENLGGGLLAADIYGAKDGQTIIAVDNHPQPVADALFAKIISMLTGALKDAKFPNLGKYVLIDMEGDKAGIVLPLGDYQWGMLVDTKKTQLGLALNVAIPKALAAFREALEAE